MLADKSRSRGTDEELMISKFYGHEHAKEVFNSKELYQLHSLFILCKVAGACLPFSWSHEIDMELLLVT